LAEAQKLFFALWPDDLVRKELLGVNGFLPAHGGRPPHPEDLHITLVFLGQVSAEQYPCVTGVADGIQGGTFSLSIDQVGYWRKPRILWCGPRETPPALQQLVADLQQGLKGCGFKPEKRAYSPHVTLARKSRQVEGFALEQPFLWCPAEFVLVSSGNASGPPRYRILQRWPLGLKK
jgi:2'-5' RNA ligase